MTARPIVLAAGGTGGHMVPASVLADELARRGRRVVLFSDDRGLRLPGLFEGVEKHRLASGSPSRGGVAGLPGVALGIARGVMSARGLLKRLGASVVVGFGGYPSLPALVAALALGLPTVIHEQNAVLGRVNRLLAPRVDRIATSYARTQRLTASDKVRLTGNPVRPGIAGIPPPAPGPLSVLVLGGSQGASILSTIVPTALARLGQPVQVTQQCREADIAAVRAVYAPANIAADLAPYFLNVGERLHEANLVIARAGASTIAELTACGRPSILVPLPSAMDDHQTANARALADAGGAVLIPQGTFTVDRLLSELHALTPDRLTAMAEATRAAARPNAAAALADVILETIK